MRRYIAISMLLFAIGLMCLMQAHSQMLLLGVGPGKGSAGGASGPSFTASGPGSGVVNAASTNFTVTLSGTTFNGSTTITISDGSQGGTITPSVGSPGTSTVVVTPVNGATGFTFTYTPVVTPSVTLTFTNAQSWGNANPLVYASLNTFDPANKGNFVTLSGGNLTATVTDNQSGPNYQAGRSITNHASGKSYFECAWSNDGGSGAIAGNLAIGIANSSASLGALSGGLDPGFDANLSASIYGNSTAWSVNSVSVGATTTWVQGDAVGIAMDAGAKLVWQVVMHSGAVSSWNGSFSTAQVAAGTGGVSISGITGPYFAMCYGNPGANVANVVGTANFGASTYQIVTNGGAVPSGFGNF